MGRQEVQGRVQQAWVAMATKRPGVTLASSKKAALDSFHLLSPQTLRVDDVSLAGLQASVEWHISPRANYPHL